jgi:hypothetical protein
MALGVNSDPFHRVGAEKRTWKTAAVAKFMALSQHFHGETEKYGNPMYDCRCVGRDSNCTSAEFKTGATRLWYEGCDWRISLTRFS